MVAGATLALGFCVLPVHADWPHYLGPTLNGVAPEKAWSGQVPGAVKALWKTNVGKGTSGVTVVGDRAFTMGNVDGKDVVVCLDVKTGKEVWKHEFPLALDPNMFEGGPRATPTVDGNRVYSLSHQGDLWCLDAATGKKVWYKHYQKDFGGRRPDWGFAGSPTVADNLLLCDVGGTGASTVALNKATGDVVWKSGDDKAGYASPIVATLDGKQTVVVFKADHLVGYDLKDGHELWRTEWKTSYDVNAATPLIVGKDRVFVSSGYNTGCALFEIKDGKANQLWRNKNLRTQINTAVPAQGYVYGLDGNTGGGNLVCLDLNTGEKKWEEKSVKGGSLILADGKLIILSEKGELVVADASPNGFKASLRAPVLDKRCWVQPTLSAGRLFVKDNDGNLACLDFGAK
ncbi:outer membrane protein assembly factor BamB family protein [Verrucomicrobiota bacterium sgz303538]